jgi:hypothetical protein
MSAFFEGFKRLADEQKRVEDDDLRTLLDQFSVGSPN